MLVARQTRAGPCLRLTTARATRGDASAARIRGASIGGVGVALPATVRTNAAIAERLGVDEGWIVARTGVRERRVAAEGEGVAELSCRWPATRALAAAGADADEIDLVLVATMSHDHLSPAAAPLVAELLGARNAGAIDVDAACCGLRLGDGPSAPRRSKAVARDRCSSSAPT